MQFGSAAFEGMRCYATPKGPAIFRLRDHLKRLANSCKIYRIEIPYSIEDLAAACCRLVDLNRMDSCYIRPMVVRGYGAASMIPFASPIEVYLPCWPWGAYLGPEAIEIDWSDDPDVATFVVRRDGYALATVTTTALIDASVLLNEQYCYRVSGYDVSGALIAASATACVTLLP